MLIDFNKEGSEREGERKEREEKKNIDGLPVICAPTGNRARNLGVCPDWKSNPRSFGVQGQCSNQLGHPAGA